MAARKKVGRTGRRRPRSLRRSPSASLSTTHNWPDLPALSHEETTYVEAALEAVAILRKTFEFWTAIARGLKALKDMAERLNLGRKTFDQLREREGLGKDIINKTRVSRLLTILANLSEVERWREGLTDKQRFEWASPEAVHRHCPLFAKTKPDRTDRLTPLEQAQQTIVRLEEELHNLKQQKGDERYTPIDTAENMADEDKRETRAALRAIKDLLEHAETAVLVHDRHRVAVPKGDSATILDNDQFKCLCGVISGVLQAMEQASPSSPPARNHAHDATRDDQL
jgi:hypothetical protein